MDIVNFPQPLVFEWDGSNEKKIFIKRRITKAEAEQAIFNPHLFWFDEKHSGSENRYNLLGMSDLGKLLFIAFTIRKNKLRVISARTADKRERAIYGQKVKKDS